MHLQFLNGIMRMFTVTERFCGIQLIVIFSVENFTVLDMAEISSFITYVDINPQILKFIIFNLEAFDHTVAVSVFRNVILQLVKNVEYIIVAVILAQ